MMPTGSILEERDTPFKRIKNTWKYCAADPFVFVHNNKTYIFAELINVLNKRGEIGYCIYDAGVFTKWTSVIQEPYHLSYPFIFEQDGNIYIIPESNKGNNLCVYEATDFPEKWKKIRVLKQNVKYVDTTFLEDNGRIFAFTYDISDQNNKKLLMYSCGKEMIPEDESYITISNDDAVARPGGKFFDFNGKTIRVSQNCKEYYGKGLVFSEIKSIDSASYIENNLMTLSPEDIVFEPAITPAGIHTYNSNELIEVIDFKTTSFKPAYLIGRFSSLIRRTFKGTKNE